MPPPDTDQATAFGAPAAATQTAGPGAVWSFPSNGTTDPAGPAVVGARPSGPIELSMRPRPLLLALLCALAVGAPVALVWLSYSAAAFDGRIPFVAAELLVFAFFALRARYVVADRALGGD